MTETKTARRKRDVFRSLGQPKVAVMLALGFSSGLPFLLSGNTLGYAASANSYDSLGTNFLARHTATASHLPAGAIRSSFPLAWPDVHDGVRLVVGSSSIWIALSSK